MRFTTYYKYCSVPYCGNNSKRYPNKLFIPVPPQLDKRKIWMDLAGKDRLLKGGSVRFCEDHFNLPEDMLNYEQYKKEGSVAKIHLKEDCVPTRFDCQRKRKPKPQTTKKASSGLYEKVGINTSGKSKVAQARPTSHSLLDATASSNNEKISILSIEIEPSDSQDAQSVIFDSSTSECSSDATTSSNEEEIPIRTRQDSSTVENAIPIPTELLNPEDSIGQWTDKLNKLIVSYKANPQAQASQPTSSTNPPLPKPPQCLPKPSEPISVSSPIYTPVTEAVSATKITNLTNAWTSPGISCKLCYQLIKGYTYVCVQCDYRACKGCDDIAEHNQHYVLRVPVKRSRQDEIEAVIKQIDEFIVFGKSLAADFQLARARKIAETSALKRKITSDSGMCENTESTQKTLTKSTLERPEKNQRTEISNPGQNIDTQYTVNVRQKENSQIPGREIAEIVKTNEKDIISEHERIPTLNVKQESKLTEEEIKSLHTVKDELDDPLTCEQYPDATVPLSDQQPPIRGYEPTPSTSSLYQPSSYMSDDDEETDTADELYDYL